MRRNRQSPTIRYTASLRRCRVPRKHYQCISRPAKPMRTCIAPRRACMICLILSASQKRGLERQQALSATMIIASELAKLPTYYVMEFAKNMAETVAEEMPDAAAIAANQWLPDSELSFYSDEYARTGIPGQPAMVSLRHLGRVHRRTRNILGLQHRHSFLLHLGQAGPGHLSTPRRVSKRCSRPHARACSAVISSTAPVTGCSRSSRRRSPSCLRVP